VLSAVRPNEGLQARYRRQLARLVEEMHRSVLYWVTAAYRARPPELAQDASPAELLREIVRRLRARWQDRFDEAAPALAKYFATAAYQRTDAQLKAILGKAGFAVPFRMTRAMNDVLRATIGEQVALIKSIASQHFTAIEGMVMRSAAVGGDLKILSRDLRARYGVDLRRAALIARDQNRKAMASMTKARQQGLGIEEAVWMHSHAGARPRPTHVKMDGKRYEVGRGMYDSAVGKYVWPGTEINCRCVARSVIPGLSI
jgi:SPP1 gp7 family putative phage head morphogenesis protein